MISNHNIYHRENRQFSSAEFLRWLLAVLLGALLLVSGNSFAQFWKSKESQLLKEDEAFQVSASITKLGQISIDWVIADDYYMYRDQYGLEVSDQNVGEPSLTIGPLHYPPGVIEDDPEFGEVEVYFYNALLRSTVQRSKRTASDGTYSESQQTIDVTVKGQGCNKPVGICYPPISRTLTVALPDGFDLSQSAQSDSPSLVKNKSTNEPLGKSFFGFMLAAFGTGILLSFTPCVLPMIPILAGVIAGQRSLSRWRSVWLACCYVAGTVVTYMIAGAVAGATGAQLQAWFQNVWVIGAICLLLIALALSLFGMYRIELPSSLQTKLNDFVRNDRSAAVSSFSLGLVSALVVGACVSPLLIVALGAAISQGDPVLGAGIMGSMALGMGTLLIVFGIGAGWLLPKSGVWMTHIQVVFGFSVLGVALYLLAAFPAVPILLLWAALFLTAGFYIWRVSEQASNVLVMSVIRAVATGLVLWGVLAGLGAALRGDDVLHPLRNFSLSTERTEKTNLPFVKTFTAAEVERQFDVATAVNKPVMLDFYADWCLDCKRMHRTTYKDPRVAQALAAWHLIEVDVTKTSPETKQVKEQFDVFGPPATLFFDASGQEVEALRQYGYIDSDKFLSLINQAQSIYGDNAL